MPTHKHNLCVCSESSLSTMCAIPCAVWEAPTFPKREIWEEERGVGGRQKENCHEKIEF